MGRGNKGDVESAGANNHNHPNDDQLYPMMLETPQLRWAFIRKVYVILCMQMLLTTAVAATVVFFRPIPDFLVHTRAGLPVYIVICILPFIRNFLYIILTCPLFFVLQEISCGFWRILLDTFLYMFIVCSFVPIVLLPQASPSEHVPSHAVHDFDCIDHWTCLCFHQRYLLFLSYIFFFLGMYVLRMNPGFIVFFLRRRDKIPLSFCSHMFSGSGVCTLLGLQLYSSRCRICGRTGCQ